MSGSGSSVFGGALADKKMLGAHLGALADEPGERESVRMSAE